MDVVTRDSWGARPPRQSIPSRGWTGWVVLHHTAGPNDILDPILEAAYMRSMQQSHFARGWADIGQHYTVMRSGRVYAGRAEAVVGAHCPGRNSDSVGIEVQGTFLKGAMPSDEQIHAIAELVHDIAVRYSLSIRHALTYHRQWCPTACPGDLVKVIPRIIDLASMLTDESRLTQEVDMDSKMFENSTKGYMPLYVGEFRPDYRSNATRHMGAWANFYAASEPATVSVWWRDDDGKQASAVQKITLSAGGKRGVDLFWLAGTKNLDGVVFWEATKPVTVQIDRWIQ